MSMARPSAFEQWWLNAWPHRWHIRRSVPKFLHACPEPFRGQVLEVGAGSGWTSRSILETYPQVELTATDIDPRATRRFERLQGHYGQRLRVQQADSEHLPFDRASFDMVVAFYVLHHLDDVGRAIEQFMRVLRPGGLLGLADENQQYVIGPLRRLWQPANQMTRHDIRELVSRESTIKVEEGDAHYYLWAQKSYPF